MSLTEVIWYGVSGVVLLWAFGAAGMAFSGSLASGLHHIAHHEPGEADEPAQPTDVHTETETTEPPRTQRPRLASIAGSTDMDHEGMTIGKIGNYLLAFGVLAALVLMVIGTLVA